MIHFTQHELETLEVWLQQKINSIPTNPANTPEKYGEVNLSKAILKFIKYMVQEERNRKTQQNLDNIYNQGYNISPSQPVQYNSVANASSIDTICQSCKTKNSLSTHCIHKVVVNCPETAGE